MSRPYNKCAMHNFRFTAVLRANKGEERLSAPVSIVVYAHNYESANKAVEDIDERFVAANLWGGEYSDYKDDEFVSKKIECTGELMDLWYKVSEKYRDLLFPKVNGMYDFHDEATIREMKGVLFYSQLKFETYERLKMKMRKHLDDYEYEYFPAFLFDLNFKIEK